MLITQLQAIGFVQASREHAEDDFWGEEEACISLTGEFTAEALQGLAEFSHVEIIYFFHQVDPSSIVTGARHPRNNPAWPAVGIFAQRGKNRPNRIGSTICRVVRVEGTRVIVSELDAINGTPVLDIKPVMREFLPRQAVVQPAWSHELMREYWTSKEPGGIRVNPLRRSWTRCWTGIGARTDGQDICDWLVERYREPHRKYHTLDHLRECLDLFETVQDLPENPAEVEAALWFHDAIYQLDKSDNEKRSADRAKAAAIHAGASAEVATRIHSLVMATKHTAVPTGIDEQVLVDIDLAILGAPKDRFAGYQQQIRAEYAHVPGLLFQSRRRAILRSFLDRPRIYSTPHFHGLLEARARENLLVAIGAT